MYDHRIGIAAVGLLALPFGLTFMLIALVGLTTAFLLLGHMGAILSNVLRIVLPIPALVGYLDAISSPYSLLVAIILVAGIGAAWIHLSVRFNADLFRFEMPPSFSQFKMFWTLKKKDELSPESNKKGITAEDLHSYADDTDNRTVIHPSPPTHKPHLNEDHNPYIRRVSRTPAYENLNEAPQQRLRPTASAFEYSSNSMPRRQSLRPTASAFDFKPEGRSYLVPEHERAPRSMPRHASAADEGDDDEPNPVTGLPMKDDYPVSRRPYNMHSSDYEYKSR